MPFLNTRSNTLVFAALLSFTAANAADFATLGKAIDAVTKHHFARRPPEVPFSIAKVSDARQQKYDSIDPALERAVIAALGPAASRYVPLRDLCFPRDDERDPKDPSGKTYRGIESAKSGGRVYIFYISHIQYVDSTTLHIHYSKYNGPLAAGGGFYIVRLTKGGFQITEGEGGWVS